MLVSNLHILYFKPPGGHWHPAGWGSTLILTLLNGLPECCFKFQKDIIHPGKINMEPTKITPFRKEHDLNQTSIRTCSISFFRGVSKQSCTRNLLSSSICWCFHVKLPSCFLSRKVSWGWLKHIDCNMTRFAVPFGAHILEPTPLCSSFNSRHVFEIKANLPATSCLRSSNNNNNNHHQHLHIATSQKSSPNF